jgi:hypothetical protein
MLEMLGVFQMFDIVPFTPRFFDLCKELNDEFLKIVGELDETNWYVRPEKFVVDLCLEVIEKAFELVGCPAGVVMVENWTVYKLVGREKFKSLFPGLDLSTPAWSMNGVNIYRHNTGIIIVHRSLFILDWQEHPIDRRAEVAKQILLLCEILSRFRGHVIDVMATKLLLERVQSLASSRWYRAMLLYGSNPMLKYAALGVTGRHYGLNHCVSVAMVRLFRPDLLGSIMDDKTRVRRICSTYNALASLEFVGLRSKGFFHVEKHSILQIKKRRLLIRMTLPI